MNFEQLNTIDKANEGVVLDVLDPRTGGLWEEDGKVAKIRIFGVDSKEFEKLDKEASADAFKSLRNKGESKESPVEKEIERCIRLTVDWENIGDDTGPVDFNYKNAKKF
ncbi:MAG: hypothetical protein JRD89_12325 [Deltaproteobacteria bacterium]|nr:hypothetical protein [Deltaproteobacteria bacterium]